MTQLQNTPTPFVWADLFRPEYVADPPLPPPDEPEPEE